MLVLVCRTDWVCPIFYADLLELYLNNILGFMYYY